MSTSTKVRFLAKTANGAVHAVGAGAECPIVKKGAREGTWKGMRSIPPAKVLNRKDCARCDTHARAEAALNGGTYGENKTAKPSETKADKANKSTTSKAKAGAAKKAAASKPTPKNKEVRMTQAGPRSVGGDSEDKAKQLLEFAKQHGWKGKVNLTGTNQASVTVSKKDEGTIVCNFVDGKYDVSNQATLSVGDWTGTLRGAHRVRKQMSLEGGDRPIPKPGASRKRSPKADADSGEDHDDTERVVPWSADSKDAEVINAIRGKVIEWRNRTSGAIDQAEVAAKGGNVCIEVHPKTMHRMLSFAQVLYDDKGRAELGGERVVRIDRIINVRPA